MSTVRRWRVRKLRLTSSSHWWSRVHDRGSFPSSPPTGRDAFAECRRYAVLSAAAPPASCPRVPPVPERTELSCRTWESSEPVWIVFGRRFDASGQRAGCSLNGDDLPELGREVRLHIVRTRQQSGVARADDLFFGIERRDFLYPGQGDGRIERSQSPQHCGIQRDVVRLRVSLGTFASLHHRRTREPHEYRLSEVRMSNHQLPFLQGGQLCSRRGTQHRVARRRKLVGIHPAAERSARVPDYAPMHLRAELLRAEQHETEVAAAL